MDTLQHPLVLLNLREDLSCGASQYGMQLLSSQAKEATKEQIVVVTVFPELSGGHAA